MALGPVKTKNRSALNLLASNGQKAGANWHYQQTEDFDYEGRAKKHQSLKPLDHDTSAYL